MSETPHAAFPQPQPSDQLDKIAAVVRANSDPTISWQSYIEGMRSRFGVSTIYDFAMAYGLAVEAVAEYKGWLRKTVTFTVRGPRSRVRAMQRALAAAVEEANRGT